MLKSGIVISVIIPTYKRPLLLENCLNALLGQSIEKNAFEIIVVTDGPDEETFMMLQKLQKENQAFNISGYSLLNKRGPAAARNTGWKLAKGELIAFTDDDCIPDKNWLNALWQFYSNAGKKEIAFTGKLIVPLSATCTDYEANVARLETCEFITANCACSRIALEQVNGFDENFTTAWREDSDLQFKFLEAAIPVLKVPAAIVTHPVRKAGWGISFAEQKKSMFNALLFKKHPLLYKQKISSKPVWGYYIIICAALFGVFAVISKMWLPALIALGLWLMLVLLFAFKRMSGTSKNIYHVTEMVITSMFIPFLSVFWTLYGAAKYKTFFL